MHAPAYTPKLGFKVNNMPRTLGKQARVGKAPLSFNTHDVHSPGNSTTWEQTHLPLPLP